MQQVRRTKDLSTGTIEARADIEVRLPELLMER
jgi:hypothetical protein